MSMELILSPKNVEITQGIMNKEYLKNELACQLEYYKGLAVTEDNMKDAKSDRAALNKLRTAIDGQRKAVKKQVEGLYKPFENDCKELTAMIDEPIAMIDKQIAALDDVRKREKYAALKEFFSRICSYDFVKLDDVLNPKWSNSTSKLDKLKEEVAENVQRIADDYAEIRRLYADSPMMTAIVQRFEQTRDKGAALAYAAEIERRERAEQERRAREEAEKQTKQPPAPEPYFIEKSAKTSDENVVTKTTEQPEPTGRVAFAVTGTRSQIVALREFMKANNITFEVIKR